jgi:hypothetical protein
VTAKIRPNAAGVGANRGNRDLLTIEAWKAKKAGKQPETKQVADAAKEKEKTDHVN